MLACLVMLVTFTANTFIKNPAVIDRNSSIPSETSARAGEDSQHLTKATARLSKRLVVCSLICLAVFFGVRSMMTYDIITDETAHLASWRNRYSGDLVSPYLVRKFASTASISPAIRTRVVDAYLSNRPLRFMTYWLTDSPMYSTIAETVRAASGSSIYALRTISLIAILLTVPLLIRLGNECWDADLGVWLASLFVATPMIQFYAGIGRSYALIQCTTVLLVYRYVMFHRDPKASSRPVFLAALLAQSIHPAAWFAAFPLVIGAVMMSWYRGASLAALTRESWWYVAGSLAILIPMAAAVSVSPSVGGNVQLGFRGLRDNLDLVNPFGALTGLNSSAACWMSAGLFVVLICAGLWAAKRRLSGNAGVFYVGISGVAMAAVGAFVAGSAPRHLLVYFPVPLLVAAIGMRAVLGSGLPGRLAGLVVIATLLCCAIFSPIDGYKRMLPQEGRFSEMARWLQQNMKNDDEWVAWLYYSNAIYSYAHLPEPFLPIDRDDFEACTAIDRDGPLYVLTVESAARSSSRFSTLTPVMRFPRRAGDFIIFVLHASPRSGDSRDAATMKP